MGETLIGIKMADQSFYPVMEEGYRGKKRLVLTTARDNQDTVRIDLYRSSDKTGVSSYCVGSLVLDNIEEAARGEPEIEVILSIDEHKHLNAIARNLKTHARQRLQASLENTYLPKQGEPGEARLKEKKRSPIGRIVFITTGILLVIGLTVLFTGLFSNHMTQAQPLIEEFLNDTTKS